MSDFDINKLNAIEGADADNEKKLDFSFVLASSVHDMKNSLTILLNLLEEFIEHSPPADEHQQKRFSVLQYEASRINSELIQLLTIYRLQQNNLPFNFDENFVSDTFDDQVARNEFLFEARNIQLDIDCDMDFSWFYDNEMLGNVIHNVLINSARYAKSAVKLSAKEDGGYLVVAIEDDGNGFPEFMIDAADINKPTTSATDSTQLGLFFAGKIAHYHKQQDRRGRIELSNGGSLGGGVFTIFIP